MREPFRPLAKLKEAEQAIADGTYIGAIYTDAPRSGWGPLEINATDLESPGLNAFSRLFLEEIENRFSTFTKRTPPSVVGFDSSRDAARSLGGVDVDPTRDPLGAASVWGADAARGPVFPTPIRDPGPWQRRAMRDLRESTTGSGLVLDGTVTVPTDTLRVLTQVEEDARCKAVAIFGGILSKRLSLEFIGVRETVVRQFFAKILNIVLDEIEAESVEKAWWSAPWECEVALTKTTRGRDRYLIKVPQLRTDFICSLDQLDIGIDTQPPTARNELPWLDELDLIK